MSVWVLVFYMATGFESGGPAVIDNIATMEECQRISTLIPTYGYSQPARCIEVRKAK
jgi:hypothetical protein